MHSAPATAVPATADYVGRFAPTPSGLLHFGSLLAALASFLDARAQGGRWLLRIDDIDKPREVPGAADAIQRSLEAHGLHWDGPVLYQSRRLERYHEALQQLQGNGLIYACQRSRRERLGLIRSVPAHEHTASSAQALRVRVPEAPLHFNDGIQGPQTCHWQQDGDFIVFRRDGCFAYQLVTAVDDAEQGITGIVRGSDLLDSSFRQQYLMTCLGQQPPTYAHIPVATTTDGRKLSKQNHAPALSNENVVDSLWQALAFLNQPLPDHTPDSADSLLTWATQHWSRDAVPKCLSLPLATPA